MHYAITIYTPVSYWEKRKIAHSQVSVKSVLIGVLLLGYLVACMHFGK